MGHLARFAWGSFLVWGLAGSALGQTGVHWYPTLEGATAQAAQSGRLVFVYLWSPQCQACRGNEHEVLAQPAVAASVHAAYLPVKVNHEQAPDFGRHYGVRVLPTILILRPDGTPLDRIEGRVGPEQLAGRLTQLAAHARPVAQRPSPDLAPPMHGAPRASMTPPEQPNPPVARNYTPPAPPVQPAAGPAENPPLGLDGYCTVSLGDDLRANRRDRWVLGNKAHGVIHRGRTYLFADAEKAARFYQDPDRYAPVLSGQDIVLAVEQGRAVEGKRGHGAYFGNRVYLFAGEETLQRFENNPNYYADAAHRLASRSAAPR